MAAQNFNLTLRILVLTGRPLEVDLGVPFWYSQSTVPRTESEKQFKEKLEKSIKLIISAQLVSSVVNLIKIVYSKYKEIMLIKSVSEHKSGIFYCHTFK